MAGVKGQKSGGHNKKTRKELELAGTYRKDRHEHLPPDVPEGIPTPPRPLDGEALEEWQRMITRLTSTGALSAVDDAVLYQYCQLFAETEGIALAQAETAATVKILQENLDGLAELTFADLMAAAQEITKLRKLEAGYITKVRQGRMALRMLLTEFGLTPASRGRVKVPEKTQDADEFTAFQKKKPGLVRVK
jgi:P27 family predicted phage terminase small subunit